MVIYKATNNCGGISLGDYVTIDVQQKPDLGDLALFYIEHAYIAYVTTINQHQATGKVLFVTPMDASP